MLDDFRPVRPGKSLSGKPTDLRQTPKPSAESTFKTPDEVAAIDVHTTPALDKTLPPTAPQDSGKPTGKWAALRQKLHLSWPPGQKEWIASAIIIVVCGSITGFVLTHTGDKPVASAKPVVKVKPAPPKPTTVASTLTGIQVDPTVNQRIVIGAMIENSLDARPQSGLSQAGVVFEAIAEGGITRFLALFQDTAPEDIGPIRSARPYYAQWAQGFDAGYAHVGGSPQALANIKEWGVRDLDQFANAGAYRRITTRVAPHNVYTGVSALAQLAAGKGYTSSTFTGFNRATKEAPSKTPNARTIDMAISGPLYNTHYDYKPETNSYARSEGGAAHMDANGNVQISPKVVIALVMNYGYEADGYHSSYTTIGSGTALIFQNGEMITANWTKKSNAEQFTFTDPAGKPVALVPGQTWLTAIGNAAKVTYAP